jgi:vacuolar iron transporter family protein
MADLENQHRISEIRTSDRSRRSQAQPTPEEILRKHLGQHRQYWRDIILGVNDGLVSTFLLAAGVVGGGLSSTGILQTVFSGALAGAISMCAGEYVATKSQNEVIEGEICLEGLHVRYCLREEIEELQNLFGLIGIDDESVDLRIQLSDYYQNNPDALLKIMTALEFGVLSRERRSPIAAGLTSCGLFFLGSLPSVIPFAFPRSSPLHALIEACALTTFCLLIVGAVKTWASRGSCLTASLENLAIASVGGALSYGVGILFSELVH